MFLAFLADLKGARGKEIYKYEKGQSKTLKESQLEEPRLLVRKQQHGQLTKQQPLQQIAAKPTSPHNDPP